MEAHIDKLARTVLTTRSNIKVGPMKIMNSKNILKHRRN